MGNPKADHAQVVDAREIEGEPFEAIMSAVEKLDGGETMLLVNSFEPEPLYNVLGDRGLSYETTQVSADEWHVEITR